MGLFNMIRRFYPSNKTLMRMGAALVLPVFIGKSGVFFAEGAAWVCAAALNLVWYYMQIGKIKREMLQ